MEPGNSQLPPLRDSQEFMLGHEEINSIMCVQCVIVSSCNSTIVWLTHHGSNCINIVPDGVCITQMSI